MGFVGIDPGKSGAIASLDDDGQVCVWKTPLIKYDGGYEYDREKMLLILRQIKHDIDADTVAIEIVHAFPGISSHATLDMGIGWGYWRMAIEAVKMRAMLVASQSWSSHFGLNQMRLPKGTILSNKEKAERYKAKKRASIDFVKKHFPRSEITKDGEAEAVILALYAKAKLQSSCVC